MKEASQQKSGMSDSLAEARTGLFRATLLFGSIAAALALIVVPAVDRHTKVAVSQGQDLDMMPTGSNSHANRRTYVESRSVLWDSKTGPCLLFPDGTQRGAC